MTNTANSNHLDKKAVGCTKSSNLLIVREFMPLTRHIFNFHRIKIR